MSTSASSRPGQGRSTGKAAEPRSGRPVRKASGSSQEDLVRAVPKAKVRRARLVVSKVANFSIDLPEASVAIQVSGAFGSRQEEAQRLGRLLRPKAEGETAHFYTIVSRDTVDADFAQNRQRFLAEQGYAYRIVDAEDVLRRS